MLQDCRMVFSEMKVGFNLSRWMYLLLACLLAALLRFGLVGAGVVPFNSDEAVVALMARHILQGETPIFFYGQAYMGSLDAWLVAAAFALLGEEVWVIRLVQGILYTLNLVLAFYIFTLVDRRSNLPAITVLLLAVPAVNLVLYTTATLGGYNEALLIGELLILVAVKFSKQESSDKKRYYYYIVGWGFLSGFGLWVFGLSLVYSIPVGLYLFNSAKKYVSSLKEWILLFAITVISGIIGAFPWWIYAFQNGLDRLLIELGGGAIAGVEGGLYISRVARHVFSLVVFGGTVLMGLRPPWAIRWLALPLAPFVVAFWLGVVVDVIRSIRRQTLSGFDLIMFGVIITTSVGFVMTPFGADPSGRYFLPLYMPLYWFAAKFVTRLSDIHGPRVFWLVGLIFVFHSAGIVQSAIDNPPGITTQFDPVAQIDHSFMDELIHFLDQHNELRGFTNYWVAYPLAFQSKENIIFVPRLPYHQDFRYTDRDDRYDPYDELVYSSKKVAYITTKHPALNQYLREKFDESGIEWMEKKIGDYQIFFNLSRPIFPQDIGLGETTIP